MNDSKTVTESNKESSRIYTLYYSFFLIPFMIAIFGAVFFLLFRFITFETNNASELLNQIKIGSASKRWQSAYELSKVFNNPDHIPDDLSFKNQMISAYNHSKHDDPLVRSYLAIAMGVTRDNFYAAILTEGLNDENRESRLAAIQAVGMVGAKIALPKLKSLLKKSQFIDERLAITISTGYIGDSSSIPFLQELLYDEEPNIRWDAAIGLAKMGDTSSVFIIENLLDRNYLSSFPELTPSEIDQVISTAIYVTSILKNDRFYSKLQELALDKNLKIRNSVIKTIKKTYNK
jgi:HEAT repeat protein